MLLSGVCAAAACILLIGAWLGWHMRGDEVAHSYRQGHQRGFHDGVIFSRNREAIAALRLIYERDRINRIADRVGWPE